MSIPEGYGFIAGRSRENAQAALDAAKKAGVASSLVRTTKDGYLVPNAVLDVFEPTEPTPAPEPEDTETPEPEAEAPAEEKKAPAKRTRATTKKADESAESKE